MDTISNLWTRLISLAVIAVYLHFLLEWLFFVTKQSFMSTLDYGSRIGLLLATPLPEAILVTVLLLCFRMLGGLFRKSIYKFRLLFLGRSFVALLLGASMLLLVDNFTLTVLGFGIDSSSRVLRLLYGSLYIFLAIVCYRWFVLNPLTLLGRKSLVRVALGLYLCSGVVIICQELFSDGIPLDRGMPSEDLERKPNILLIGGDGINADNLSAYGYHRDTTPELHRFTQDALVCENAFSNASASGASIASTLTGRFATETRLIYPPDILTGRHAYQHLPGILRTYGYRSIDLSVRHYADAYDLNLRGSFDVANFRSFEENWLSCLVSGIETMEQSYFREKTLNRLQDPLLYIFGLKGAEDFSQSVSQTDMHQHGDRHLTRELLSFIDDSNRPFFAHLHLMGTHGPKFYPSKRLFSLGSFQEKSWMQEFYDDSILEFDQYFQEIIQHLELRGILNETLVVVSSDHGQRWRTRSRLPLIFRFPEGEYAGKIKANTQNLDIAPTVLDYLGVSTPEWMSGQSLISSNLDPQRIIFSAEAAYHAGIQKSRGWQLDTSRIGPPFYSLQAVSAITCDRWYRLDLIKHRMVEARIPGHTRPCGKDIGFQMPVVQEHLLEHLFQKGYDVSDLRRSFGTFDNVKSKSDVSLTVPFSLKHLHPLLEKTFISVALSSVHSRLRGLEFSGWNSIGELKLRGRIGAGVPVGIRTAFLLSDLIDANWDTESLSFNDRQGIFMVGDQKFERLDGLSGELPRAKSLYLPLDPSVSDQATVLILSNLDAEGIAGARLILHDRSGQRLREMSSIIEPMATRVGLLTEWFPGKDFHRAAYLQIKSRIPISAFMVVAREKSFQTLAAQTNQNSLVLLAPHFMVDSNRAQTKVMLIHAGQESIAVEIEVLIDEGNRIGNQLITLEPGQIFITKTIQLIEQKYIDTGKLLSGYLRIRSQDQVSARSLPLLGGVYLTDGGGRAETFLPLVGTGYRDNLFSHLAHSEERQLLNRLILLNPGGEPARVKIQIHGSDSTVKTSQTITIPSGTRVEDLLSARDLFGSSFALINGSVRVSSDQPIITCLMFTDTAGEYLATIGGQPLR